MKRLTQIACIAAILCSFSGCLQWNDFSSDSKQPEKVLFDQAMDAAENGKFDVAYLTLRTLVNTYPDSDYAVKAGEALKDPRIASCCKDAWMNPPLDDRVSTFFPQ
jgi:outer membrane protein assembly factor BamD (BamD/ComL family)